MAPKRRTVSVGAAVVQAALDLGDAPTTPSAQTDARAREEATGAASVPSSAPQNADGGTTAAPNAPTPSPLHAVPAAPKRIVPYADVLELDPLLLPKMPTATTLVCVVAEPVSGKGAQNQHRSAPMAAKGMQLARDREQCTLTMQVDTFIITTSRRAYEAAREAGVPAFVGGELAAMAYAAENDRASRTELLAWIMRKRATPNWQLDMATAMGAVQPSAVKPPTWKLGQVAERLGFALDRVDLGGSDGGGGGTPVGLPSEGAADGGAENGVEKARAA